MNLIKYLIIKRRIKRQRELEEIKEQKEENKRKYIEKCQEIQSKIRENAKVLNQIIF